MYKSLFSRLTVSFFITLLMIALIILITLSVITNEEPKRQFSEKLLRYMISEIGTPPAPERLKNFVEGLDISLTVTGKNNYLWRSKGRLLDIKKLEELTTPDTDFEFLNIDVGDQVVLLRHNGYNYYISDFLKDLSNRAKIALGIGFILLLLVLRLNYRFIHWLFYPIKQLKSDVLRISEGDINHHIKTNRNDEAIGAKGSKSLGKFVKDCHRTSETLPAFAPGSSFNVPRGLTPRQSMAKGR